MKKRLTKILVTLCCVALLVTAFSVAVTAAEEKKGITYMPDFQTEDPPTITGYNWYPLGKATSTEQTAKYFIINTTAGQYNEKLYISLPAEGGFRLQSVHEVYQNGVQVGNVGLFEPSSIATIDYKKDASGAVILTGSDGTILRYVQGADGFVLQVLNKQQKKIVSISNEQISFAYKERTKKVVRTMVEFPVTADGKEVVYQGGERYNDTNQLGWYTSLTNGDCWSNDQWGYINVPIFHSNRGYSVWFNMTYSGECDMAANDPGKWQVRFDGDKLDFFLWAGTPTENIKKYTSLTGTSGMYNEWTFGFWTGAMSRAFNNRKHVSAAGKELLPPAEETETKDMNVNGSLISYQNMVELLQGYMDNYGFYPEAMYGEGHNSYTERNITYQEERGIKSLYWYHPGLTSTDSFYDDVGMSVNPVKDPNGQHTGPNGEKFSDTGYPYMFVTQPLFAKNSYQHLNKSWVDYSNPTAKNVFNCEFNIWKPLWDWGVRGAMIDYGENLPFSGTCWNGLSGLEMHNLNSYYYAKYAAESFQEATEGDYVLFQRSGVAGSQYYVGNFLGDQRSTWVGYADQIYAMISLGASGYNLYGGDLGGLGGEVESDDLFSRWTVLSTFSPWMRQHGAYIHKAWEKGEANTKNFGSWYYFRKNIVPTVMSAAMDANKNANPIVKGMMVAYPFQLSLSKVNDQYLFCDDFLVCPVMQNGQFNRVVNLPNGSTWYSLFTYERFAGNQSITVEAPTAWSPVFVKAGAVKAINLPDSMILADEMHDEDASMEEGMEFFEEELPHASLLITPPDEKRTSTIYVMDGDIEDFRTYDSHTEVYTNAPTSDSTFTLTADNMDAGSERTTILALGTTAKSIIVDGEELTRYRNIPDYFNEEYGYHVEAAGLTTIYVPAGWKEITIEKGDASYKSLPMYGDVDAMSRLFDDNVQTAYQLPLTSGANVEFSIDTEEPVEVKRMVLKWAVGFLSDYDIEYTEDGEVWDTLYLNDEDVNTVVDGAGSFDVLEFEAGTKAIAFRLNIVEKGDSLNNPTLYEVSVYAPTDFDKMGIDDEMTEYPEDEEWDEDDWDDTDGKTKKKKKIIRHSFPWWAIALIIGGAVVLATGVLLLILLLLKKKKKKAAEEALQEAEVPASVESPTDFPNPVE